MSNSYIHCLKIYSVNLSIQSKRGKIQSRKNSVFGHFSRSARELVLINMVGTSDVIIKSKRDFSKRILFHHCRDFGYEMELNSFNKQWLRVHWASCLGSMSNVFLVIMCNEWKCCRCFIKMLGKPSTIFYINRFKTGISI